jgi:hypothetical protein
MMKKALCLFMILFLVFSISRQVSAHPTGTSTGSAGSLNDTTGSSNEGTADTEEMSKRLYDEGYALGREDGYNEKAYESFDEEACTLLSDAECSWYKAGYSVGYQKGKREKEAEVQAKKEEEFKSGEGSGYEQGLIDYKQKTVESNPSGILSQSKEWNEGYIAGYKKAIQLMDLSIMAKDEGYQQGLKEKNMTIPSRFINDDLTKKAFEEGFKAGEKKRIEKLKKEYVKQGYELQDLVLPEGVSEKEKSAIEEGYEQGKEKKMKEVIQEGFNDAFTYTVYQIPKEYKNQPKLQEWHKKGFKSNKDARLLRESSYKAGKDGKNVKIPKKYKDNKSAIIMAKKYYELGKAEREAKIGTWLIGGGVLLSAAVTGGYILFRRKKTINEDKRESEALEKVHHM